MNELLIVGAGGSSRDIIELVEDINKAAHCDSQRWIIRGLLDDDPAQMGQVICDVPVVGGISLAADTTSFVVVGIASSKNRRVKRDVVRRLALDPARYATLVHPTASVSSRALVGKGTVLLHHVIVGPQATLGAHVLICAVTTIGHDATISDYVGISPQAAVSGGVRIDECAYIGSGARLRENIRIGESALIGIGSVVISDVDAGRTVLGNPARRYF